MGKEECRQIDEWLTPKELAVRLKMSPSTVYSLVRRGAGIPCAAVSKGKILFSWVSVNKWLHELEEENRKRNFED
ncbi:MAG: helix-turn-helix domain-containing protein [Deltaproteobacteria bacterium]|jgi:excisionase family DNA binding protein|nr:helix-turn-helix domain-containing protein [Deltaproteobacteria bacterium]